VLADDAHIERIIFDGPSGVIDVGEARSFTGATRRAIELRDRHCQVGDGFSDSEGSAGLNSAVEGS
jgi:hypothetical protein